MLHHNEVDFTDGDVKKLTAYLLEADKLGKNYVAALTIQLVRQGVVIPKKTDV